MCTLADSAALAVPGLASPSNHGWPAQATMVADLTVVIWSYLWELEKLHICLVSLFVVLSVVGSAMPAVAAELHTLILCQHLNIDSDAV